MPPTSMIANIDTELVKDGSVKWLITHIATLGEEKHAVTTLLNKTTKRQQARKRKAEKERQQKLEQKRRLEEKRLSNKKQLSSKDGTKLPQVDLTKTLKIAVKTEPDNEGKTRKTPRHMETKYMAKEEGEVRKPKIKLEPMINVEQE